MFIRRVFLQNVTLCGLQRRIKMKSFVAWVAALVLFLVVGVLSVFFVSLNAEAMDGRQMYAEKGK